MYRFESRTAKKSSHSAKRHARQQDTTQQLTPRLLLKGSAITLGIGFVMTVITALIAYFSADPNTLIQPLAWGASAITALMGGFVTARIHRHSALICGLFSGGIMTCVMILASLFLKSYATGYSTLISTLLHTAFILLSIIGAFLGLKQPKKPTHRRK